MSKGDIETEKKGQLDVMLKTLEKIHNLSIQEIDIARIQGLSKEAFNYRRKNKSKKLVEGSNYKNFYKYFYDLRKKIDIILKDLERHL